MIPPSLLTPAEAGELLGYSRRRVSQLIAEGWFPANAVVRLGRGHRKPHFRLVLQRLLEARLVSEMSVREWMRSLDGRDATQPQDE